MYSSQEAKSSPAVIPNISWANTGMICLHIWDLVEFDIIPDIWNKRKYSLYLQKNMQGIIKSGCFTSIRESFKSKEQVVWNKMGTVTSDKHSFVDNAPQF